MTKPPKDNIASQLLDLNGDVLRLTGRVLETQAMLKQKIHTDKSQGKDDEGDTYYYNGLQVINEVAIKLSTLIGIFTQARITRPLIDRFFENPWKTCLFILFLTMCLSLLACSVILVLKLVPEISTLIYPDPHAIGN